MSSAHPITCFTLFMAGFITTMSSQYNDGDLRLSQVEEHIHGMMQSTEWVSSYHCLGRLDSLENRTQCDGGFTFSTSDVAAGQPTPSICTDGWIAMKGTCYKYVPRSGSWQTGRDRCVSLGGDLARIHNSYQNDFLARLISAEAWFLLNDRRSEGRLEYSPGERATYSRFDRGEPNDGLLPWSQSEDCVHLFPLRSGRLGGLWNDAYCGASKHAVCSRDNGYLYSTRTWTRVQNYPDAETVDLDSKLKDSDLDAVSEVYWIDDVSCVGDEERLSDCPHGSWGKRECGRNQAVTLTCSYVHNQAGTGGQSLVNAKLSYRGRLQIYHTGVWRYVCDRNFGTEDAQVACRQLRNLPHLMVEYVPSNSGSFRLRQYTVGCSGTSSDVVECSHAGDGLYYCPENIKVQCHKLALTCADDRYGTSCEESCGHCAGGRCSLTDGQCLASECQDGFFGSKCDQPCMPGNWGTNCSQACGYCNGSVCDVRDGSCTFGSCQEGYKGRLCQEACPAGTWGPDCSRECGRCSQGHCDVTSGKCQGDSCEDGYTGTLCDQACAASTWGVNCEKSCGKCPGNACHGTNGTCLSEVCQLGYEGERCTQACASGRWGRACSQLCGKCKVGTCDVTNGYCPPGGCKEGYGGPKCLQECDVSCPVCPNNNCAEARKGFGIEADTDCKEVSWVIPVLSITSNLAWIAFILLVTETIYLRWRAWKEKRRLATEDIMPNCAFEGMKKTKLPEDM